MILKSMKLERFYEKIPFCASWIGFRKSGKSFSLSVVIRYLVKRNAFKRCILFLGNRYCNPELVKLIEDKFDSRLIFATGRGHGSYIDHIWSTRGSGEGIF